MLKDMKELNPIEVAEFSIRFRTSKEPVFIWWVPFVIKKKVRNISEIKSKYWTRTTKYGIKIPKNIA